MHDDIWAEAYQKLNLEQKKAVDTIEGPVMVVAGPGTGKTQILTLRIANILRKTDSGPENILALTFTESGARAMRERLRTYIGGDAYKVPIHTFHGFAERLIRDYPEYYVRIIGGRPITDIERIEIFETILQNGFRELRPIGKPDFYIAPLQNAISTMKREYIRPEDLSLHITHLEEDLVATPRLHEKGAHKGKVRSEYEKKEKMIRRMRELETAFRMYDALLRERLLYDFDDMIGETITALESHEDMLRDLQETYHYVLADEHQDVNRSQNRILELLASYHTSPNMFVVGDEKQAIYRFQGASLENFLYFDEQFGDTTSIALTQNYRSGQQILDNAHALITADLDGAASSLRVPLVAASVTSAVVTREEFQHQGVEDAYVMGQVETLLRDGVSPKEIAVILRTNKEVEHMAGLLRKRGVKVAASLDRDILSHPITKTIRTLMMVMHDAARHEEALIHLLHEPFLGTRVDDLYRVLKARNSTTSLWSLLGDETSLVAIGVQAPQSLMGVRTILERVGQKSGVSAPHRVLEMLVVESGLLAYVLTEMPEEGGAIIRRLYDEVERMVVGGEAVTLADVLRILELREYHGLPLVAPGMRALEDAVRVMTAHKSKGLEFEYVFVPHLVDSVWGGKSRAEYFNLPLMKHLDSEEIVSEGDDERRLLYVALTRAKLAATLSFSSQSTEGRELSRTRLFEDMGEDNMRLGDGHGFEDAYKETDGLVGITNGPHIDPMLILETLLARGLSVTALNNYLRSPWEYIYKNVIRVPEVQNTTLLYGTALHGVMRSVGEYKKAEGAVPSATLVKKYLERELEKLPLSQHEYTQLHEKALTSLTVYLEEKGPSLSAFSRHEFKVRVLLPTGNDLLPEVPLTGVFDRLDFDEEGNVLRVVDYKTGKPKTRGEIEGTTKNSDGDYKRQLTFYALMLELYGDERYRTREGILSFIEPDSKGRIHEETFIVTDEDIELLKGEIIRVALEIQNGTFVNVPCDPEKCSYCDLVSLLSK